MKIEEKVLIKDVFNDISVTDMHIIEAIGYDTSRSMSSVAKDLDVTVGTLTIAINSLVKKAYVKRIRSSKDRRVVLISLTEKGHKAFKHHENFHEKMIKEIADNLEEQEYEVLVKSLKHITEFFDRQYILGKDKSKSKTNDKIKSTS